MVIVAVLVSRKGILPIVVRLLFKVNGFPTTLAPKTSTKQPFDTPCSPLDPWSSLTLCRSSIVCVYSLVQCMAAAPRLLFALLVC